MNWQGTAACSAKDVIMLFFGPEEETRPERLARERSAKTVCARCPVRKECLDEGLYHPVRHGIWGGLNWEELSLERRRLRAARAGQQRRTVPVRGN